jgi:hypothetical protein
MHKSLLEAVESFDTTRLLAGHRVQAYAHGENSCKICHARFTEQQELKKHLVVMHAYRLVCPYRCTFVFSPRYSDLFREHLTSEHEEVTHADTLILNSSLQSSCPSNSGSHGTQNNDLRASVNFGAFTMFKAPNVLRWPGSPTDFQTRVDTVAHFLPLPCLTSPTEDI